MRINRYLSQSGLCSRRKADELVNEGRVYIGDRLAEPGSQVSEGEIVKVDGKEVTPCNRQKMYFVFNKPVGVICSSDPKAVNNIIEASGIKFRVFPVGRLDVASSGLIFLTNDGDFANRIMHPSFEHEKEYEVRVDRPLTDEAMRLMGEGIHLLNEKTLPAKVYRVRDDVFRIILKQGLNRQIRRMCEALDYTAVSIKRIRIMNISLGSLLPGECRQVKGKLLKQLLQNAGLDDIKKSSWR